jgi:hypothetical protein
MPFWLTNVSTSWPVTKPVVIDTVADASVALSTSLTVTPASTATATCSLAAVGPPEAVTTGGNCGRVKVWSENCANSMPISVSVPSGEPPRRSVTVKLLAF